MKKLIYILIASILLPVTINAETYTYEICKSGCEYNDFKTMFDAFKNNSNITADDDVVINFKDDGVYAADTSTKLTAKKNYYLTINGNDATIINYSFLFNSIKGTRINNLNMGQSINNNLLEANYSDYYNPSFNITDGLTIRVIAGPITINNCNVSNFSIGLTTSPEGYDKAAVNIYNSKVNYLAVLGDLYVENSDIYLAAPYISNTNTAVIKNSSLYLLANGTKDNEDAYIDVYDTEFKELNYFDAKHNLDDGISFANNTKYGIIDNANNTTNSGNVKTRLHYNKDISIKKGEKINYIELFNYLNENDEIIYAIDDENIVKVDNNIITGLESGTTKIVATNKNGLIDYTLNVNVLLEEGTIEKKETAKENFGKADFSADNLVNVIPLTQEEQDKKEQGKDIDVFLDVKDITESVLEEEKVLINEKVSTNETLAMYLDVNLFKQVEGEEATKIEETNGNVLVSFKIPEELINKNPSINRTYYILRLHDGVVDKLETTVNDNKLMFETNKFSTYALTYVDTNNPKTGDNIVIYLILGLLSIICIPILIKKTK